MEQAPLKRLLLSIWGVQVHHRVQAPALARLQGRFLLSLNDVPGVRAIFAPFKMARWSCSYMFGNRVRAKKVHELLIEGGA